MDSNKIDSLIFAGFVFVVSSYFFSIILFVLLLSLIIGIVLFVVIYFYSPPKIKEKCSELESKIREVEKSLEKGKKEKEIKVLIDEGERFLETKNFSDALKKFENALTKLTKIPYQYEPNKFEKHNQIQSDKNMLKTKIEIIKDKINEKKINQIKINVEKGESFKNQSKYQEALQRHQKALKITDEMFTSEEKNKNIKEIKKNIDNIYLIQIEILIDQGNKLKTQKSFDESLEILKNALNLSDKMFSSKEKNKIKDNIKKNIDSIYSDMIKDVIENGNRLRKDMEFDNSIKIFKDALKIADKMHNTNKKNSDISNLNRLIYQAQIAKIKNTILSLGVKFDRLHVSEIAEKCKESDEYIINTALDMINKKEIYAEYFQSTKSVVFDKQANIDEIDALMEQYKKWEKEGIGKK